MDPYSANNNPENKPFKDTKNMDYHLINGTEGVFFNDSLIVSNEMIANPTVFQNDIAATTFDKKLNSERELIEANFVEEVKKIPDGFLDSTELEADKPILEYFNLDCSECCLKFKTFYEFKSHFKIVHHRKGKVKCCSKTFTCRFEVIEHISLHQNPEKFK